VGNDQGIGSEYICSKNIKYMQNLDRPLVSILINNYNYGRFLTEAIDSAISQTYPHTEIIVVDDGSTDNSHEIIASYRNKIVPIIKQNGGQASAFNTGFAASHGDIICFLDADDIFLPHKVTEIVKIFTADTELGWCFHALNFFGASGQKFEPSQDKWSSGKYDLRATIKGGKLRGNMPEINLATSTMCFKRDLLAQILPMPEAIRITSDDYIKYLAIGLTPGFISISELARQRIHGNNAYTLRTDRDKQKLFAKINILTAYWMKSNFSSILAKFSNNIFAYAMSIYWVYGGAEVDSQETIDNYLATLTFSEKIEVYTRIIFNYMKYRYYL
jgi:glycosyltransferase involved in cell wall biosynthesis